MPPLVTPQWSQTAPFEKGRAKINAHQNVTQQREDNASSTTFLWAAFALLAGLWAAQLYFTWGAWGSLTVDSGHEMYIPWQLAKGKVLYRDVWFPYGPGAPYFNSYLFRLFGSNLNVLYWAGSLAALASAAFLFLTGIKLSHWLLGWTAGAVVVLDAFQPSIFSFPLPYSYAAVYGCLLGCLFVWLAVVACTARSWFWMLAAGTTAAAALLVKPEFGTACYGTAALLIAFRGYTERSWTRVAKDILAFVPGVLFCAWIVFWMISLAGPSFITQENLVFWPSSYFMQQYGQMWLHANGFNLTASAFKDALFRSVPLIAVVLLISCLLWWKDRSMRAKALKLLLVLAIAGYFIATIYLYSGQAAEIILTSLFFPRDMVLYVALAVPLIWFHFWTRREEQTQLAPVALLFTFSALIAFRILLRMMTKEYPIYYNGPVLLSFLLLPSLLLSRANYSRRALRLVQTAICLGCLSAVAVPTFQAEAQARGFVPLVTDRGTIRVPQVLVPRYQSAINFMKEKAALGQVVLSVPEDTSLYFFSGTESPMRVFSFTPGIVAPGVMTEKAIHEIESKNVRYLLWSNRIFPEFGVPIFGKDFNPEVGEYLHSHYHRVGLLFPNNASFWEWTVNIWERNPPPVSH